MKLIRDHIQNVSTHIEGLEEEHKKRLKEVIDRMQNVFSNDLAKIRSQNKENISALMKEINTLKSTFATERAVRKFHLNLHDLHRVLLEIFNL